MVKWQRYLLFFKGLKFQVLVFPRGSLFASSLKPVMVFFRVPNLHDFRNLLSKCFGV